MPCTNDRILREAMRRADRPKLAERGFSEEQIADLEARSTLAREKAKAQAYAEGRTLEQQQDAIEKAVNAAVDEWHRDIHAALSHDMDSIRFLGKVRQQIPQRS